MDGGHVERLRLRRVERLAVAGAFDEGDARLHRVAVQRLEREHERPPHQAVDDQPVLVGIDVRDAGMAALEVQPGRRDDAVEQMQRRARRRRRPASPDWAAAEMNRTTLLLETRRLAVAREARARAPSSTAPPPAVRRTRGERPAPGAGGERAFKKDPAAENSVARRRLARLGTLFLSTHTSLPVVVDNVIC